MKCYTSSATLILFFIFSQSAFSHATVDACGARTFVGEITIYAKSDKVWKVLTDTKKYVKIMDYKWGSGKKDVDTVGDLALMEFLDEETTYELTFIEPGKKLSVKTEPSHAEYKNEKTWVVIPVDKWTTKVKVADIYKFPSGKFPPSAQQEINLFQERLEKLKSMAETS